MNVFSDAIASRVGSVAQDRILGGLKERPTDLTKDP